MNSLKICISSSISKDTIQIKAKDLSDYVEMYLRKSKYNSIPILSYKIEWNGMEYLENTDKDCFVNNENNNNL